LTRPRAIAKTISSAPRITTFQTARGEAMPSSSHGDRSAEDRGFRDPDRDRRPGHDEGQVGHWRPASTGSLAHATRRSPTARFLQNRTSDCCCLATWLCVKRGS